MNNRHKYNIIKDTKRANTNGVNPIYLARKPPKNKAGSNRDASFWYYKEESHAGCVDEEVVSQELHRLVTPRQPKTRSMIEGDKKGVISKEIPNSITFREFIAKKINLDDYLERGCPGLGEILVNCLVTNEGDLHTKNILYANDLKTVVKLDGDQTFSRGGTSMLRRKHIITTEDIASLPYVKDFLPANWLDQYKRNANGATPGKKFQGVTNNIAFRHEVNRTILRHLILPFEFIRRFVADYIDDANQADKISNQIRNRISNLRHAALGNDSFKKYVVSTQASEELSLYIQENLKTFVTMGKNCIFNDVLDAEQRISENHSKLQLLAKGIAPVLPLDEKLIRCQSTGLIFLDPIRLQPCKHTVENDAYSKKMCPVCNEPVDHVVPQGSLSDVVSDIIKKSPHLLFEQYYSIALLHQILQNKIPCKHISELLCHVGVTWHDLSCLLDYDAGIELLRSNPKILDNISMHDINTLDKNNLSLVEKFLRKPGGVDIVVSNNNLLEKIYTYHFANVNILFLLLSGSSLINNDAFRKQITSTCLEQVVWNYPQLFTPGSMQMFWLVDTEEGLDLLLAHDGELDFSIPQDWLNTPIESTGVSPLYKLAGSPKGCTLLSKNNNLRSYITENSLNAPCLIMGSELGASPLYWFMCSSEGRRLFEGDWELRKKINKDALTSICTGQGGHFNISALQRSFLDSPNQLIQCSHFRSLISPQSIINLIKTDLFAPGSAHMFWLVDTREGLAIFTIIRDAIPEAWLNTCCTEEGIYKGMSPLYKLFGSTAGVDLFASNDFISFRKNKVNIQGLNAYYRENNHDYGTSVTYWLACQQAGAHLLVTDSEFFAKVLPITLNLCEGGWAEKSPLLWMLYYEADAFSLHSHLQEKISVQGMDVIVQYGNKVLPTSTIEQFLIIPHVNRIIEARSANNAASTTVLSSSSHLLASSSSFQNDRKRTYSLFASNNTSSNNNNSSSHNNTVMTNVNSPNKAPRLT
jgi:hypothetical protein